jgi:hypothetical protein
MTAQSSDKQLTLHTIGIGDKHTDGLRSGGGQIHMTEILRTNEMIRL